MQALAEGAQPPIKVMPLRFVREVLLELLHILFVAEFLEQVQKLIAKLRQFPDFLPDVV